MKVLQGWMLPAGFLNICSLWTETPTPTHPSNKSKNKPKLKSYAKPEGIHPGPLLCHSQALPRSTCCLLPFHTVGLLLCFLNLLENNGQVSRIRNHVNQGDSQENTSARVTAISKQGCFLQGTVQPRLLVPAL